jgi:AcrR family transcriptional regulator
MARRNEHSLSEIKAMVLNAAETIITEEGFSALTIRKIAMEIGYTVGSIYMVFASRAELILHLNARTLEDITTRLQPITSTNDIETWLKAYLQYARTNPQRWRMIFTPESKQLPDWYQAQLDSVFQQFAAYFTFTTPEQKQTVYALWQGIQGICLLSPDHDPEASVLLLLRTFLRGWNNSQ